MQWAVARQAPLSMGFSKQEYWSGLSFPSPGDLTHPGIEPASPALQTDSLPTELSGKLVTHQRWTLNERVREWVHIQSMAFITAQNQSDVGGTEDLGDQTVWRKGIYLGFPPQPLPLLCWLPHPLIVCISSSRCSRMLMPSGSCKEQVGLSLLLCLSTPSPLMGSPFLRQDDSWLSCPNSAGTLNKLSWFWHPVVA